MAQDDDFTPRIGRMRALGSKRGQSYLGQVLKAANLAGGVRILTGHRSGFTGARIGRGAGVGRVLASRDRFSAYRQRRVMTKLSLVRFRSAKAVEGARRHIRYVQRDGVTREGEPGRLYSAESDRADGKAFMDRCDGDRHQFRVIVSAEDGAAYDDLKPLTRRLMAQMEADLGTRLDWVAVDHHNTGHPHTHIIVRGRTDRGRDLVIARTYIYPGLRERAAELVALDLGPRTDLEIENSLRRQMTQDRLTTLDRRLIRDMGADRIVVADDRDRFRQSLRAGRLQHLSRLGLAEPIGAARWRLSEGIEHTLRRMGERGDIIRTMQRDLAERGIERPPADYAIYDPAMSRPLVGRLVKRGLSDEFVDRHYVLVEGVDGRSHYADIGKGEAVPSIPDGAVVRIAAKSVGARPVDRTVADIAAVNAGRYSVDIHLAHDRSATQHFAETHVRRLEAMRRVMGNVEREADGTWVIAIDHVDRAAAYEVKRARDAPASVEILSSIPLDRQVAADGATWLDRELASEAPEPLRDAGFGREVRDAQAARRRWLIGQGLAEERPDRIVHRAKLLSTLRRRELKRVASQLASELGLTYDEAKNGERIEGVYRRPVELVSGRYALIEKSHEFTLVPWRPVLDRYIGRPVTGMMRGDTISWTIGRSRSGPSLS